MLHVSIVSIDLLLALETPARRNARLWLREVAERLERQHFGLRRGTFDRAYILGQRVLLYDFRAADVMKVRGWRSPIVIDEAISPPARSEARERWYTDVTS